VFGEQIGLFQVPESRADRREVLPGLWEPLRQPVEAVRLVPTESWYPGESQSLAPAVGDAIWTLDCVRLPSGDKLAEGWVIEWGGWWTIWQCDDEPT
jgi:hypothetical protein